MHPTILNDEWPWKNDIDIHLDSQNCDWPRISIITPSYNQGQYIEETILSVLNQNYPNLEYMIIDGGSTDNTVQIIKKYEQYITYWVSEKDEGQTDAINKGIARCTGTIFNWLNSDDFYLPGTLYSVANEFRGNKELKILCGKELLLYDDGRTELTKGSTVLESIESTLFAAHIDQPPTFFDFNMVKRIAPLSLQLYYTMDVELWLKALLLCHMNNLKVVDTVFNKFRIHKNSKTGTDPEDIYIRERHEVRFALLQHLQLNEKLLQSWYSFFDQKIRLKQKRIIAFRDEAAGLKQPILEAAVLKDLYLYESYHLHFSELKKYLVKFFLNNYINYRLKLKLFLKIILPASLILKVVKRDEVYFFKKYDNIKLDEEPRDVKPGLIRFEER